MFFKLLRVKWQNNDKIDLVEIFSVYFFSLYHYRSGHQFELYFSMVKNQDFFIPLVKFGEQYGRI